VSTLTLDLITSRNHCIVVPPETKEILLAPLTSLEGRVTVRITRGAKGGHHQKGICLKQRSSGSHEIRGTVQPGDSRSSRAFVAQVHPPLNPDTVYDLWKSPPVSLKKKTVNSPLPKASIDAMRQVAASAPPVVTTKFNFGAFWKEPAHFNQVLELLQPADYDGDKINGEAFRTAVRAVLEARDLKLAGLELARSINTICQQGLVESMGNSSPYSAYRLLTPTTAGATEEIEEEEADMATIADRIETQPPKGEFVLNRFWDRNIAALKQLDAYVTPRTANGILGKNELEECVRTVLVEYGGEGTGKQVGTSLQALSLMGVVKVILPKRLEYRWDGIKVGDGSSKDGRQKNVRKKTIIEVVTVSVIIDTLTDKTTGDDGFLDKDVLNTTLDNLYAERSEGKTASKSMISRAVHQLFVSNVLISKGLRGSKTFHLSPSAKSDAETRKVVAPRIDLSNDPWPLVAVLEGLKREIDGHPCLKQRSVIEILTKTTNGNEEAVLLSIDRLLKDGYLALRKGKLEHTYKVTAQADLYLLEARKKAATGETPDPASTRAKVAEAITLDQQQTPAITDATAQPSTTSEARSSTRLSPLERVGLALIKVEAEIESKKATIDDAHVAINTAQTALAELQRDKKGLEEAKKTLEDLERTAEQTAQLTAKYAV